MTSDLIIRRQENAKGVFRLIETMRVERGTKEDWNKLHSLHYKAQNLPAGPVFYRCITDDGFLVGVVVLSSVALLLRPRHEVFPNLKPGHDTTFTNVHRGKWLNKNLRRAARIVTDTLFRGVGVSYRMVNLAMRIHGYRYIEIQSSMSKFNPFDVKAGFRHANLRAATPYSDGLNIFRRYFSAHPADYEAILAEYSSFPAPMKTRVYAALIAFYYRHSAKEKTGSNSHRRVGDLVGMPERLLFRELQQLIFATPVYGIWVNPDVGREIPASLPLTAFDLQGPTEPLRLDLLCKKH